MYKLNYPKGDANELFDLAIDTCTHFIENMQLLPSLLLSLIVLMINYLHIKINKLLQSTKKLIKSDTSV